jgi:hypothetical protein
MQMNNLTLIGPMLFLKFSILMVLVVSLTIVKPMAIAAHKSTQKICSLVMHDAECAKHC